MGPVAPELVLGLACGETRGALPGSFAPPFRIARRSDRCQPISATARLAITLTRLAR